MSISEHAPGGAQNQDTGLDISRLSMLIFIASEAMFFSGLIVAYLYIRGHHAVWPPDGIDRVELVVPFINTVALISSSFTAHFALKKMEHGKRGGFMTLWLITIVLGLIFLGGQAFEYIHAPFAFKGNVMGTTFFTLTGFHGFHVLIGAIYLAVVLVRTWMGMITQDDHKQAVVASMYWHFVDVVWIFLLSLLYLW